MVITVRQVVQISALIFVCYVVYTAENIYSLHSENLRWDMCVYLSSDHCLYDLFKAFGKFTKNTLHFHVCSVEDNVNCVVNISACVLATSCSEVLVALFFRIN